MAERTMLASCLEPGVKSGREGAETAASKGRNGMDTQLLVIGAGPYALSTAALAREHGIDTTVVGLPMGFWRQNMPRGMFLRSGPDWHLDGSGVETLEAYLED